MIGSSFSGKRHENLTIIMLLVADRSKAWTVFAHPNAGIVGSSPTQVMDACLRLFCVYVVLGVGSGLATGWSPIPGVLPTLLELRKWSETKRFTDGLCSKVGARGDKDGEREILLMTGAGMLLRNWSILPSIFYLGYQRNETYPEFYWYFTL
jgi:hypothetical protein